MNFGEKLTNLRRQKGLSQEELGEELNVTRQTISKWELGQTSPDTSKLTEISKFFGVGVNELTNEEDIELNIDSENDDNEEKKKTDNRSLLIFLLALCVIVAIVLIITGIYKKNEEERRQEKAMQMVNQIMTQGKEYLNQTTDIIDKAQEAYEQQNATEKDEQKEVEDAQRNLEQYSNNKIEETKQFQQELLEDAQKKQQEMMQNASPEQQQMLQDAQARQKELLQKMQ